MYLRGKFGYTDMIKNLVFDFGGVLTAIDTKQAIERFRNLGLQNPEEYLNAYKQTGIFFQLENGDIDAETFCTELGKLCGRTISYYEALHAWMGFIVAVQTEWMEYLQTLRGSYRLCVLSNTNPFLQGWARSPKLTAEGKSLDDYFDELYLSYLMGCSKPGEEIYKKMLADGNMLPEETLFVDDGERNIEAAKELGIRTLKAVNGEDWRGELEKILKGDSETV
jgi:putative hydrolase of the HAD superfamily